MMLNNEQRKLYDLLHTQSKCFVRICDDDSSLWVSDFPRKCSEYAETQAKLLEAGFSVRMDEAAKLWYVDWTSERWREVLALLPKAPPCFPEYEELQEPYALCRLFLAHPAPLQADHFPAVRRVLKQMKESPDRMRKAIRPLWQEAACGLREGKTIAHAAGFALAAWIEQHDIRKETEP